MTQMVSPNDMMNEAKKQMLSGREPSSDRDWELVANFFAANIESGLEEAATILCLKIFGSPLSDNHVSEIAAYQAERKTS